MFSLIHGNRQDILAKLLASRLSSDPPALFAEELVVVQSEAMARWLRLVLAEELGIAAQLRFPFPASYLWQLYAKVLAQVPAVSPFSAESLHWRLFRLLSEFGEGELWAPVRRYLGEGDPTRRDGLALKLAATFERYLAYRPDWLAAWAAGRLLGLGADEAWQAALWRALIGELPELPAAHPREAFFAALAADPGLVQRLPQRISLFGIGAMPPEVFEVFRALGRHIEVNLYLLNPCRAHWGDLVNGRLRARVALAQPGAEILLDRGHPLLGSLGSVARQFFDRVSAEVDHEISAFEEIAPTSLLAGLQADMLDLVERGEDAQLPVAMTDDSVQIHVCHSPMREVDVLHDRLLALFDAHPELRPSDVLVLAPDLETYAPRIEARFSARGEGGPPPLPFTIADRPPSSEAPLQRAFHALLALAQGRLEAESVLALLEHPAVARRFEFEQQSLEQVRGWVAQAAIRWGVDGTWRGARELPADAGHSWRAGLQRLLLGMALPAVDEVRLFAGQLPAAAIEGAAARDLGRLISFAESLFAAHAALGRSRSAADWALLFERLLKRFFAFESPAAAREAQLLRQAWQGLAADAAAAACGELLPLAVIRRSLEESLAAAAPGWAFFGGGITFAALRAHRAVPVKVLCLLGLNDGEFPRNPAMPGFDLTLQHGRPGDRAYREEDRHAFLEALLSAHQVLHISHVGRDIRDNALLPPSPLVAELIDALVRGFRPIEGGELLPQLRIEHPLQAFSGKYFSGQHGLYSYAVDQAAASRAAAGPRQPGRALLAAPLPAEAEAETGVTLDELLRCLSNPARRLLHQRLGIQLADSEGLLDSAEPFVLDSLDRYGLDQQLLDWRIDGLGEGEALARAAASGALPHGPAGEVQFRQRWQAVAGIARNIAAQPRQCEPLAFALNLSGISLNGRLAHLAERGLFLWRPAKAMKAKDWLRLWVHHLALQLVAEGQGGLSRHSYMYTLEGEAHLFPVADAEVQLGRLIALGRAATLLA